MSNTRRAQPGAPLKQNRFASSPEIERGLIANLVAQRCSVLERPEDRQLIWFIQQLSHARGGLEALAVELLAKYGERIGTVSMQRFGKAAGRIYCAEQVRAVRDELPEPEKREFPLRGEIDFLGSIAPTWSRQEAALIQAERNPSSYPAEAFRSICKKASAGLEADLAKLCLDPAGSLESGPWYFAALLTCLREHMGDVIKSSRAATVVTALGRKVHETLDYALETRCMVLIHGLARMGKSFAVKQWVATKPGRACYVQTPSTNDEIGFFRAIAKGIGISSGLGWKAVQLRERIEDVLQAGDLILILDEAHYCLPTNDYRYALPGRINWIMTALVNHGVPVALITTPQFFRTQNEVETRTLWTSEQFIGRLGHCEPLPDSLAEEDLRNVAQALLPEGDPKSIEILVRYAQGSAKYLAGIESAVRRARYLAAGNHREEVTRQDIKQAIQQAIIPSDAALAKALAQPKSERRGRRFKGALTAPQDPAEDAAQGVTPVPGPGPGQAILSDRSSSGVLDIRGRLRSTQADPEAVTA